MVMKNKYYINVKMEQVVEAKNWCRENLSSEDCWAYGLTKFFFDEESDAMAFKLKFGESTKVLVIDPPSGWQYGFPKPYTKKDNQTLEEWLIEQGYPEAMVKDGLAKYCRYWEIDKVS